MFANIRWHSNNNIILSKLFYINLKSFTFKLKICFLFFKILWQQKQFRKSDFFNTGGSKRKNKTKKKLKHSVRTNFNTLQKNTLKEKLIDKIKDFKKKQKKNPVY